MLVFRTHFQWSYQQYNATKSAASEAEQPRKKFDSQVKASRPSNHSYLASKYLKAD